MTSTFKGLGIRFDAAAREDLKTILLHRRVPPCEPTKASRLRDWWHDNGPVAPKWDVNIYSLLEDPESPEYFFSLYNLGYLESKAVVRAMRSTDYPLKVERVYSWE